MMDLSWVWLIGLVTTHFLVYLLGRGDGQAQEQPLSEEARLELQKYSYDKFYEHERWKAERSGNHE